jgi:hypothetical protein
MGKNNNHMRSHLAYLAARLMAEDGIQDYGAAKRKAARQAGVPDTRELPDNQEIEAALKTYQSLYQAQEQPAILRGLRETAIQIFLLNEKCPFELETRNFKLGDRLNAVPVYRLEQDGAAISAAVFERDDERIMQKYKADGRSVERAKLADVKALLDAMPELPADS